MARQVLEAEAVVVVAPVVMKNVGESAYSEIAPVRSAVMVVAPVGAVAVDSRARVVLVGAVAARRSPF